MDAALRAIADYLERELDILVCSVDTYGYLRLFNGLKMLVPRSYPVLDAVVILREQLADIRGPLTRLVESMESNRSRADSFEILEKTIGLPAFVRATIAFVSRVSYLWVFTNMIDQLILEARFQNDAIC